MPFAGRPSAATIAPPGDTAKEAGRSVQEGRRWLEGAGWCVALAVALAVRLWVLHAHDEFSADEAVPALMALHIAAGREAPVFYYGQHYFGAVEAYVTAGLFRFFGVHVWLPVVPPLVWSLALLPLTFALAEHLGGRAAGWLALPFIVAPPPVLTRLFVNAGGGFTLAGALQAGALLCCLRALAHDRAGRSRAALAYLAAFGLLAGLWCWVWQPAVAVCALLLPLLLIRCPGARRPAGLLAMALSALLALAPPLAYNATRGWPTVAQLAGKYVAVGTEATQPLPSGPGAVLPLLWYALGGGNEAEGGAQPAQAILLALAVPLGGGMLVPGWLRAARRGTPSLRRHRQARVEAAVLLALAVGGDVLAAHSTARHLVPAVLLAVPFAGAALALLPGPRIAVRASSAILLLALVLGPNLWLDAHAGQQLAHFVARASEVRLAVQTLEARGLATGYSDYWTAYPVTYFASERVIIAPLVASPWGGRFDRYPMYSQVVEQVEDIRRLFLLLDRRCSPAPYVQPLEEHGASYVLEPLAAWWLLSDIRPAPGDEQATLDAWRRAMASRAIC